MSGYFEILRRGFCLDVNPISKPLVDYGFSTAYCSGLREFAQIKVTVEGHFIACVFDGKCKQCGVCQLKQWRQQKQ